MKVKTYKSKDGKKKVTVKKTPKKKSVKATKKRY